ncbi:MAG TPA: class I SAM-dependent methyltransferase [Longimicrobiales bacterium]|nr:class I SAM-dependent methyltransferase [Longimicrobiales bacterium]
MVTPVPRRSGARALVDAVTFPLRAVTLFEHDRWGLSSLARERFDYCRREVSGRCLDVGCGRHNRFVTEHLGGNGVGVDVFDYAGLEDGQIFTDLTRFPFDDASFDHVTFIASLNHVPRPQRDQELAESWRCLRPGGTIIVTMGHPLAEILVHKVVWLYDRILGTSHDMDSERGMEEEEDYFLTDGEIRARLARAGFVGIRKKRFWTQWGLNHLFVGTKELP